MIDFGFWRAGAAAGLVLCAANGVRAAAPEQHATLIEKSIAFTCAGKRYAFSWKEPAKGPRVAFGSMTVDGRVPPAAVRNGFAAEFSKFHFIYGFSLHECTADSAVFLLHGTSFAASGPVTESSEMLRIDQGSRFSVHP